MSKVYAVQLTVEKGWTGVNCCFEFEILLFRHEDSILSQPTLWWRDAQNFELRSHGTIDHVWTACDTCDANIPTYSRYWSSCVRKGRSKHTIYQYICTYISYASFNCTHAHTVHMYVHALGFSPMRNTEIMLQEHDEYILETNFLEGIGIYYELIQVLAAQGDDMERMAEKKRPAVDRE